MARVTAATVNRALKAAGHPERLMQGNGYAFFTGGDAPLWPESGVYVNRITDVQDVAWWLHEYDRLRGEWEKRNQPSDPDDIIRLGKR